MISDLTHPVSLEHNEGIHNPAVVLGHLIKIVSAHFLWIRYAYGNSKLRSIQ